MFEKIVYFYEVSGWTMYGITICSVLALAVFLERLWSLRKGVVIPKGFPIEVEELVSQRRIADAVTLCKKAASPLARIVREGLEHAGQNRERIKEITRKLYGQIGRWRSFLGLNTFKGRNFQYLAWEVP